MIVRGGDGHELTAKRSPRPECEGGERDDSPQRDEDRRVCREVLEVLEPADEHADAERQQERGADHHEPAGERRPSLGRQELVDERGDEEDEDADDCHHGVVRCGPAGEQRRGYVPWCGGRVAAGPPPSGRKRRRNARGSGPEAWPVGETALRT
ncbi:hypothetical protein RI138_26465 [Streptomyces sp. C11-1]|uniref:Uncharacterized protein n=1 Tax=Streptomyces durocortorensis TaxID=2811104 RepID=A0ABY9WBR0_9ACTN|nr:hypothetical protein [Streptomyces durocortorensis]WNF31502.1 hypothetical protein RI138_26465 [Streptomyces durocortorensis]